MNCGANWKELLTVYLQVTNGDYTFPKQSSLKDLTALLGCEIL